jgi:hypothetical protein
MVVRQLTVGLRCLVPGTAVAPPGPRADLRRTAGAGCARWAERGRAYESQRWLEPHQFLDGRGHPLRSEGTTRLTSYVTVPDTEVSGVDTVHGRVDFVQLVGITQTEVDWVAGPSPDGAADRVRELVGRMAAAGNRHLVTDLGRTQDFV